jgi:hypothetical protein
MCILLRSGHSTIKAQLVALQRWLFFWKVHPSPQRNSGALSEWDLSHLPDQGPSPPIAQCYWRPSMLQTFFCIFPQICASTQSCLGALRTIPSTSWLGFCSDMHCLNCGNIYRQVCAFPNHVQSIEFTTGGLISSCRNIKDDQWKQDAPGLNFESHSKGSEYLCN